MICFRAEFLELLFLIFMRLLIFIVNFFLILKYCYCWFVLLSFINCNPRSKKLMILSVWDKYMSIFMFAVWIPTNIIFFENYVSIFVRELQRLYFIYIWLVKHSNKFYFTENHNGNHHHHHHHHDHVHDSSVSSVSIVCEGTLDLDEVYYLLFYMVLIYIVVHYLHKTY